MKRYLLFDSGCCQCSKIAESIEQEAGGKLAIRSLRDPAVKELLDRKRPGWKWEPLLVEEKDEKVRIYAGRALARRLLMVLGPRRAWRVSKLLEVPGEIHVTNPTRREFIRKTGLAALAIFLLPQIGINHKQAGVLQMSGTQFDTLMNALTPSQALREAELALTLALRSHKLRQMLRSVAAEGLRPKSNKQQSLIFAQEKSGQRSYTNFEAGQAVLFMGEKSGQRFYTIFLQLEDTYRGLGRAEIGQEKGKTPPGEANLIIATVSVTSHEVLDVIRLDISSMEETGIQQIIAQNVSGRQSQYLARRDGEIYEVTKDGATRIADISKGQQQYDMSFVNTASVPNGAQPTDVICGLLCGFQGILICSIIEVLTGGVGVVCDIVIVVVCSFGCG